MSRIKEFKLPDLGEGLTEGEILKWLVQPGEEVKVNQPIVEVETAKAAVEVPSPYAGVVTRLFHEEGTTVDVGQPIIAFDTDPGAEGADPEPADVQPAPAAGVTDGRESLEAVDGTPSVPSLPDGPDDDIYAESGAKIGEVGPGGRTATLVGYGPKSVVAKRRARKDDGVVAQAAVQPGQAGAATPPPARVSAAAVGAAVVARDAPVLAKPPVRKLAKDLGVDLGSLTGTGPGGVIVRADVERAGANGAAAAAPAFTAPVRRADGRREERIPVKGVRKLTAEAMVSSAFTAPHVTEFLTVDVTPMMELRGQVAALPDFADVKVSPLLFVAKALVNAVRRHPGMNSTWDDAAQEIVVKHYVNLGIAAATPRGLVVPNVKDADQLSLVELAQALQQLTDVAKEGRTQPADMQGGTITITNVGVFGVDSGTPIINPGESAILCFGAVRDMPWVHEGAVAVRKVTQLSLSFDHRVIDGQLGSEFLADVGRQLAAPAALLAWS
ncbi:MAG TPA: dihydrolipoamide acetyltransferase family protein [Mycobacteriales bacterium]|jgi:pyruvate dehydrogenase E2 component (dihydrolipoamide acetyltransferase)|nr:dihydrolipoamide acetyltransferase family protein [Mycobacteriales bacterium]